MNQKIKIIVDKLIALLKANGVKLEQVIEAMKKTQKKEKKTK